MLQGWDLGVSGLCRRSHFLFKHGYVAYQNCGDDEQNRMQVQFLPSGQTGDFGSDQNVKYN